MSALALKSFQEFLDLPFRGLGQKLAEMVKQALI
jgi:hypothetical protein